MNIAIMRGLVLGLVFATGATFAHKPDEPAHQKYAEGNFALENGSVIKDFELSYTTQGTLNADKSNAILMVTAIGGNHHRIDYLIGPGKALDTNKYFVICTDAIGNGLTSSPSNSKQQANIDFPEFNIRDMVNSQYRLVSDHFGIQKLVAVVGASMGGMQALQWAVSYPNSMQAIAPIIPLAKTTAWTTGVLEMLRQSIMTDPAYQGGKYDKPVEQGMRLWAGWLSGVIVRTPAYLDQLNTSAAAEIEYLHKVQDGGWKRMDANDWIWQSRAYDRHDLGQTQGFNGNTSAALKSIKAKTLILAGTGDLLNPESDAKLTAKLVPGAKYLAINDRLPMGHLSGAGATKDENAFQNKVITEFLSTLK
ncbi:alpha/beta fold hydrolase [Polynucleobacter sp. AP-Nino-20-G2]|uniref:alpha/beta fold hydrolase n=1 Tax=Polynucleobacter sp. AP-Nino-20-G2 TaxID=2576917 RepID=UPI001BFE1890|nr:alpha/beta fold hydrolase [Polynucleobacter sp. AP-Nino-20-G2]QWE17519.1 alpha/beta fold hydrolase [Polynucleobacter sp. AP-Nino-20-G2]